MDIKSFGGGGVGDLGMKSNIGRFLVFLTVFACSLYRWKNLSYNDEFFGNTMSFHKY